MLPSSRAWKAKASSEILVPIDFGFCLCYKGILNAFQLQLSEGFHDLILLKPDIVIQLCATLSSK